MDIPNNLQSLMKMVACMEEEGPPCPKGETRSMVTHKNQTNLNNWGKSRNKRKWGQRKLGLQSNKEKLMGKELLTKNAK
jgi:hypothetical protein